MSGEPVTLDIVTQSPLWDAIADREALVRQAVLAAAGRVSTSGGEVAIVLSDDSTIRVLNRDWRGIDKPTNVLSFPATPAAGGAPALLGDIIIAYETLARESADEGKPAAHHLAHLAVHGFLHLLGYDHEDDEQAAEMEQLERDVLATLGIPDPYGDAGDGTA